jgi:ribosomal protein S27AE
MATDNEYLLYPLDTGDDPICPECSHPMVLAGHESREGKPDFVTFRCMKCGRTERFITDE